MLSYPFSPFHTDVEDAFYEMWVKHEIDFGFPEWLILADSRMSLDFSPEGSWIGPLGFNRRAAPDLFGYLQ